MEIHLLVRKRLAKESLIIIQMSNGLEEFKLKFILKNCFGFDFLFAELSRKMLSKNVFGHGEESAFTYKLFNSFFTTNLTQILIIKFPFFVDALFLSEM